MDGLTGKIKFDQRGQRTDFELDIIELKRDGLTKVRNDILIEVFASCLKIFSRNIFRLGPGLRSWE